MRADSNKYKRLIATSSKRLKVIALISGGKDSLFSILHCLANGHEVVALANLHPPLPPTSQSDGDRDYDAEGEDINSFMYQTVGHSIIPLYAEALGIPLYRQEINGKAIVTSREYKPSAPSSSSSPSTKEPSPSAIQQDGTGDETESLMPLLQTILSHHPSANALSTGAILSTYQRTRVESVAIRLNLTPLSFLWQYMYVQPPYTQSSLLSDMAAVGQESRLIKVASGGLDEGFLWADVGQQKTVRRLRKAMGRFGEDGMMGDGAVLGEGGEFETLAVDGPRVLWRRRIEVEVGEAVVEEGGIATVRLRGARCVVKGEDGDEDGGGLERLRIPSLLEPESEETLEVLRRDGGVVVSGVEQTSDGLGMEMAQMRLSEETRLFHPQISRVGSTITISNLTAASSLLTTASASEQMASVTSHLRQILSKLGVAPSSIIFSTLLLQNMASFADINPIYGALFTEPLPPARVTVACGDRLGAGVQVMLSVILNVPRAKEAKEQWKEVERLLSHGTSEDATTSQKEIDINTSLDWKRGLHVQSQSYWAPANIGPYSQAISIPLSSSPADTSSPPPAELVHIAGQIPLVPSSMDMSPGTFSQHTVLALQHLWRIGREMKVACWLGAVAFVDADNEGKKEGRWRTAIQAWKTYHDILHRKWMKEHHADSEGEGDEEDEQQPDIWDMRHGLASRSSMDAEEKDCRRQLPLWDSIANDVACLTAEAKGESGRKSAPIPPCFVAEVETLPRNADVEWASVGVASEQARIEISRVSSASSDATATSSSDTKGRLDVTTLRVLGTGATVVWVGLQRRERLEDVQRIVREQVGMTASVAYTVYTATTLEDAWLQEIKATVVPCRKVWGEKGRLAAVVVGRCVE